MKKLYRAHNLSEIPENSGLLTNPYASIDRRPRDSSIELHTLADSWFHERFGLRFRSKTLFCNGNIYATHEYCDEKHGPISIRPIGSYKLCYSDKCKDMYRHFKSINGFPWQKQQVWAELDSLNYQFMENTSWDEAATSGNEIMIYAQEFEYSKEHF